MALSYEQSRMKDSDFRRIALAWRNAVEKKPRSWRK
jgi:hypothetical protein